MKAMQPILTIQEESGTTLQHFENTADSAATQTRGSANNTAQHLKILQSEGTGRSASKRYTPKRTPRSNTPTPTQQKQKQRKANKRMK